MTEKKLSLPDYIKNPFLLFWINVVPQVILLLLNLNAFWLIRDELNRGQFGIAITILIAELVLMLIPLIILIQSRVKEITINWKWDLFFVISHIAYLWFVCSELMSLIPSNIEPWVLDSGYVILYQFTFMMPALFVAGMKLACFETKMSFKADFGRSILIAIIVPLIWYTGAISFFIAMRGLADAIGPIVGMMFFVAVTVITLVAIIRCAALFYCWFKERDQWVYLLMIVLVGIVGPLAGLSLNIMIPFPADFQAPVVYVLAILNGLILLIPALLQLKRNGTILFLRSLTYPFTLYFFLVFLPFLPVSLLAIMAMGMGFLFLVPLVLFLFHTQALIENYKVCVKEKGLKLTCAIMLLAGAILPGYIVVETYVDKVSLRQALDYVYSPDYKKDLKFAGSVKSVKRTLIKLNQIKEGVQLPYISGFYNKVVFNNMVLPDSKLEYMYKLFSEELHFPESNWGGGFYSRGRARTWGGRNRGTLPNRQVDLVSIEPEVKNSVEATQSKVRLTMHNTGDSFNAEFLRSIIIPPGVLINGFRLKVNDTMVPGQIFEKKTAMWVYHMIRDFTNRDPGILVYKSPTQVDLNVYPFTLDETRVVEIDFQFPANFDPVIYIGDEPVRINQPAPKKVPAIVTGTSLDGNAFAVIPSQTIKTLPSIKRQPYLHFILDFSAGKDSAAGAYASRIVSAAAEFENIKVGKITAANFEIENLTPGYVSFDNKEMVANIISSRRIPAQGALDLGRVIKTQLLLYQQEQLKAADSDGWKQYPIFVVVTNMKERILPIKEMEFFQSIVPEENNYYIAANNKALKYQSLWDAEDEVDIEEVIVLKLGRRVVTVPADSRHMQLAVVSDAGEGAELSIYDEKNVSFNPLPNVEQLPADDFYSQGIDLLIENLKAFYNPSSGNEQLAQLVKSSRASGVMIPATSYIVVERSSQWKTLQKREEQLLGSAAGLEFEEDFDTPAPSFWVLLVIVSFFVYRRRGRLSYANDD